MKRGEEISNAHKDIIIGRVINVTGMIGVSAGIILLVFGIVYCSYFGVALASILQARFTGFGSCAPRICNATRGARNKLSF
jgi:hypothetical protein